jgi:LmbE family N-acetylglucosaminyl deacetylase
MLDVISINPDYHSLPLDLVLGQRVLCLAPHPDDEVLGCGGLLLLAATAGMAVHTVILTAGDQGIDDNGQINPRSNESAQAAALLGLPEPECWGLPDRQLRHSIVLINRLKLLLEQHQPHWVLVPSLAEPHPDHQALSLATSAALMQADISPDTLALYYEVGAPATPNTLVDITAQAPKKWRALQAFESQELRHPYGQYARALATVRALGLGAHCEAAEAFYQVSVHALRQQGISQAGPDWAQLRQLHGLACAPEQLPLVSVIIRSMDRPSLPDALASLMAQTYPNLEVIIVNASGHRHSPVEHPQLRLALRLASPQASGSADATLTALDRSDAANLGLESAAGELGLFLDDDDLLDVDHIANLVSALTPSAVAAYTGVRVIDVHGNPVRSYNQAWSAERLAGINFLPIQSVLFRIAVVRKYALRFDSQLPVFEDWDFWCQLAGHGFFVYAPGCSATYRQHPGASGLADPTHVNHWAKWHKLVLQKHLDKMGASRLLNALAWHAVTLDQLDVQHQNLLQTQENTSQQITQYQQALAQEKADSSQQITQYQQALAQEKADSSQQITQYQQALAQEKAAFEKQRQNFLSQQDVYVANVECLQSQLATQQALHLQLQSQNNLLERSLAMLQHSRAVRIARVLRRLLRLPLGRS